MKSLGLHVYLVNFESNLGATGTGALVVTNGRLTGRDNGYSYRGFIKDVGGLVRGALIITRVDDRAVSVFGSVDQFIMEIAGNCVSGQWTYSGQVVGAEHLKVRFDLKRIHL